MSPAWLALFLVLWAPHDACGANEKKVVCYLGSWAAYRNGNGQFEIEYIQPELCTHLVYGFVGITSAGEVKILDPWMDLPSGKNGYNRFNSLKSANTKTLIAIGGWNEGSTTFSAVANDPTLRARFAQNAAAFVGKYGFDGLDVDWEYPANRGGAASDLVAFVELLKALRTEFDKYGYILSAAVGAARNLIGTGYDVPQLSKYLDFINLMAYDLHGSWDQKTGQNAPLYASSADTTEAERQLNVDASVRYWIQNGADPSKLILGMGTYGRTFTLSSAANSGVGAPASGPGNGGPYTYQPGMLGYNEICEKIMAGGWTVTWDDQQKVPYAVSGNQWVGYDNEESIRIKSQYALAMNLGGAMIWSLETDDFRGLCGAGKYPLLSTINGVLRGVRSHNSTAATVWNTPTASSSGGSNGWGSSSTPGTSGTGSPPGSNVTAATPATLCRAPGYVRDPYDCGVFYYCSASFGAYAASRYQCPAGLAFDPRTSICNYRNLVSC
ncbi:chitinase-3-like protein 1 [Schistocerca nitens]|uniref:chitinase-3-like protein 1 n=1 Tax=Schistocerca nitens TaxID=7011 RepID=UPI002119AC6D|nr:chitinase-3-like protein 1 [Schistocerca nitens]